MHLSRLSRYHIYFINVHIHDSFISPLQIKLLCNTNKRCSSLHQVAINMYAFHDNAPENNGCQKGISTYHLQTRKIINSTICRQKVDIFPVETVHGRIGSGTVKSFIAVLCRYFENLTLKGTSYYSQIINNCNT